jgi:peptidoglycan/LPS O-acetylase OafA/YrhL
VISGFYIALILTENPKYKKSTTFYIRRFARIFSGYYFSLLILFCIVNINLPSYVNVGENIGSKSLIIFSNLFLFGSDLILFAEQMPSGIGFQFTPYFPQESQQLWQGLMIPQAWSLPLELSFYLLAPFLLKSKKLMIFTFCFSIGSRILTMHLFGDQNPFWNRFFPNELMYFQLGIISYFAYREITRKSKKAIRLPLILVYFLLAMMVLEYFKFINKYSLGTIPILNIQNYKFLFILMLVFIMPILFLLTKSSKFDRTLGDCSFIVYLLHSGLAMLIFKLGLTPSFYNVVILSLVVAAVSLKLIRKIEDSMQNFGMYVFKIRKGTSRKPH